MNSSTITETCELPVKEKYDLIVCGGGIAGIAAALIVKQHKGADEVSVNELQALLRKNDVVLHF